MSQDGAAEASHALADDHSAAVAREASSPGGMRLSRLPGSSTRNKGSPRAPAPCAPGCPLPDAAASPAAAQGCCSRLGCCGKPRCCVRPVAPLYPAATMDAPASEHRAVSTGNVISAQSYSCLPCLMVAETHSQAAGSHL